MPQLNFAIPDALLAKVDAAKPDYLDRKGFLCLLLDQALTGGLDYAPTVSVRNQPLGNLRPHTGATLPPQQLASEASSEAPLKTVAAPVVQSSPPLEPKKEKRFCFSVPSDLSEFKADLLDYWKNHKSGKKSEAAAKILISGCRKIKEQYGDKALAEQLELAKGYGWENITLKNYERFGLQPRKGNYAPEPAKHPAGRVYTAKDFELPPVSSDNPLKELF